jgi:putative membrane protein
MMGWGPNMMGYGGGWSMGIFMLIFWVAVIVGIAFLVKWVVGQSGGGSHGGNESPLDILKKRYARGEIDKAEFEEKKQDLLG